jgi:hypothetical protein
MPAFRLPNKIRLKKSFFFYHWTFVHVIKVRGETSEAVLFYGRLTLIIVIVRWDWCDSKVLWISRGFVRWFIVRWIMHSDFRSFLHLFDKWGPISGCSVGCLIQGFIRHRYQYEGYCLLDNGNICLLSYFLIFRSDMSTAASEWNHLSWCIYGHIFTWRNRFGELPPRLLVFL